MNALRSVLVFSLVLSASVAWAQPVAPARKSLIINGDFEDQTETWPPVGWQIWGRADSQVPENFMLDPDNPKEGKYSLRAHHPAGSHAFPVSDPANAIATQKGMAYLVSFWYRTANETEPSVFYWEFQGPGHLMWSWPLPPSTEWRQVNLALHEGVDFFADDITALMVAFRPTRDKAAEQTLWIDEIVVSEVRTTKEPLVDERKLEHAPLNHRLGMGETFEITVDAKVRIGPTAKQVVGQSFHRLAGYARHPWLVETKEYVLEPQLEEAIRLAQLPMTRFYATGVEPWPIEQTLDTLAEFMDACGIPREWTVIELETQGASERLEPAFWARAAKHSVDKGLGFRFWEISNEPYTRKATAFKGPDDYAEHMIACSKAIRAVQPDAQIGIAIHSSTQGWGNYLLQKAAGHYDFVVGHYYASPVGKSFEDVALTTNFKMFQDILDINALIDMYNPDREVYQLDTEWGILGINVKDDPDSAWRNSNIYAAMHRAVRLIYYAREGLLRGACGWAMFSRAGEGRRPRLAFLTRDVPDKAFMNYWLYRYFNEHCGEVALDITGTAPLYTPDGEELAGPYTPTLATLSADGREMYFVIANARWGVDQPCTITTKNFQIVYAKARALRQTDRNAPGLVAHDEVITQLPIETGADTLKLTVPGNSIVFIRAAGERPRPRE